MVEWKVSVKRMILSGLKRGGIMFSFLKCCNIKKITLSIASFGNTYMYIIYAHGKIVLTSKSNPVGFCFSLIFE